MSGPIVAFDHVQVAAPAGCEDEARRFYGVLLGLEELEKPQGLVGRGGVWFAIGDLQLHVGVTESFVPAAKAHMALRAASREALERLAAKLAEEGTPVRRPDPAEIPGRARVFVEDPWGNRLELLV